MAFFRQYIAPLIVVFIFGLALIATSARIFIPNEMAAPAPLRKWLRQAIPFPLISRPFTQDKTSRSTNNKSSLNALTIADTIVVVHVVF